MSGFACSLFSMIEFERGAKMGNYLLISDAAKEVKVESHVLRYWEEELHLPIRRNELGQTPGRPVLSLQGLSWYSNLLSVCVRGYGR